MLSLPWAARRLDATSEPAGRAILLGALLLRLPLLPLPPTLSDDVLRYLWDGRVAAAGQNPYLLPPAAPELTPLRDDLWRRLPHRQIPTVYPPLAVAAFSIAARLPFPILSWKLLVTGADLAACALLLRLARQLGLPAGRTVWYAWNPMVALEVAGHGHVDVLGVAAALAVVSILLARRVPWVQWGGAVGVRPEGPGGSRPFGVGTGEIGEARGGIAAEWRSSRSGLCAPLPAPPGEPPPTPAPTTPAPTPAPPWWWAALAGAAAAFGILAKLAPAAALPMWGRQSGRSAIFLGSALALTAAAVLPVLAAAGKVPPGLVTYGLTWDWNGPLFEPLWRLLAASGVAGRLTAALDAYKTWRQEWFRFNWIYPYLYPQLLAKIVLAGVSLAAVVRSFREKEPVEGSGRLFGVLLLASATVYPWYLLWVLPWAALCRHPAWLALSGLVLLSYLGPVLGIPLWPWVWLAIWGPFYLLLLATAGRRPWSIA